MTEVNTDKNTVPPVLRNSEPPSLGMQDQLHFQRYQQKNNKVLWGIFLILAVLTGGVFFILPSFVSAPDPAAISTVVVNTAPATPVAGISPFEEAQRLRQREAAQNTLAALLELQTKLEEKKVLGWAETDFNAGIERARRGDEAYRQQQFMEAGELYQASLDILQNISDRESEIFTASLAEGAAAILAGDAAVADKAYSQALLINPDSSEAVSGLERATVLNKVLELLQNGRNLQAGNQLEEALALYRQALAIDSSHVDVNAAMAEVNRAIAERNFAAVMSRGYAALQAGQAEAAQQAFTQALALRPGSADVEAALQQARDQQTFAAISVHIAAAEQFEAAEDWQQALASWNAALTVDPNLVGAIEGQRRSESRLNLDQFLQNIVNNPLRVAEDAVFEQTRQVLADARRIANPGAKLSAQLQQIETFLERARIPVNVQLQSDGLTAVTVYRIGDLGQFSLHTLTLTPGIYTAVGVRPGYRDVRQEFVVTIDGQAPMVTIACNESS